MDDWTPFDSERLIRGSDTSDGPVGEALDALRQPILPHEAAGADAAVAAMAGVVASSVGGPR